VNFLEAVPAAARRIAALVRETPTQHSRYFSELTGADVFFKLENLQHTGSFKLRGVANCLLSLSESDLQRGVIAASSGNHGAAFSFALSSLDANGSVYVPENASSTKIDAIRLYGAEVILFGRDAGLTELQARKVAQEQGVSYISPYNDETVVTGQGTTGFELAKQLENIDAVFIAVGGGGLISGVGGYLKQLNPDIEIIGCMPENSPVMAKCADAGEIVEWPTLPTLSDGTAGGIEPGAITFDYCQQYVDNYILVSEEEIRIAMCRFMDNEHMLLEGAAGVAIAGLTRLAKNYAGKRVAVVICGANISRETLLTVIRD
jgi:threonine dehydratase